MVKTTTKRILSGLLALFAMLTFMSGVAFATPDVDVGSQFGELNSIDGAMSADCCDDYDLFEGYTIEDIQEIVRTGGQIYRDFRVHSDTAGTMTYKVPVSDGEIEYLMNIYYGNVQQLNTDTFRTHRIMHSELPHAESIVIILFGDGFGYDECDTVIYHAESAMSAMLDTHPFGLFSHLFTVYVINAYGYNEYTGFNGILGTLTESGALVSVADANQRVEQPFIRSLANDRVNPNDQAMIQIISNATGGTGFAWTTVYQPSGANVAVTSIRNAASPPRRFIFLVECCLARYVYSRVWPQFWWS